MDPMFVWLEEAAKMPVGDEIFVPILEMPLPAMKKVFEVARERYRSVDLLVADQLSCHVVTSDNRKWFVIRKKKSTPTVAFHREAETGKVIPIFPPNEDRRRQIRLMIDDGMTFEQMQAILPDLVKEELT
jgi:predicted acetyltransferase